jgi:hypothetical protein
MPPCRTAFELFRAGVSWPSASLNLRANEDMNEIPWERLQLLPEQIDLLRATGRVLSEELEGCTSDRASVLVTVSLLDSILELLLRASFLKNSEVGEKDCDVLLIKRPIPPLGSAWTRSQCAFAMGLIDRKIMDALLIAIKTRNSCAHSIEPLKITEKESKGLAELLPPMPYEDDPAAPKNPFPPLPSTFGTGPRKEFMDSCLRLLSILIIRLMEVTTGLHELNNLSPTLRRVLERKPK